MNTLPCGGTGRRDVSRECLDAVDRGAPGGGLMERVERVAQEHPIASISHPAIEHSQGTAQAVPHEIDNVHHRYNLF